jgi:hypothetical protein
MAVEKDSIYSAPYSCLVSDLVDGYPITPNDYPLGATMKAHDTVTKELVDIYQIRSITGAKVWYKL